MADDGGDEAGGADGANDAAEDSGDSLNLKEFENQPAQAPAEAENEFSGQEYAAGPSGARDLEAVYEIPVQVSAVLGKSSMQVSNLLKLGRGAVVELDRKVGEAIDIYVNNRLVARGEVVVVDDKLGVTMTEIIKSDKTGG
ncbi:MAG: flagellar motor switch protein FliN [Alphaproteobacteria bacterium]|nr:flagellar motor switch protein FliN [Alphaproteobacteria bacterium]